jgi:predicted O-methyltransferase YrrM
MSIFKYPDWSTIHHLYWTDIIEQCMDITQPVRMIEVGCFEGRSTMWFADRLINEESRLFCIDTWQGGEEIERVGLDFDMEEVKSNFFHNIAEHPYSKQIMPLVGTSQKMLTFLLHDMYTRPDFIYLDGSHTQKDTLIDLVLSLSLVKVGGIIVVDDYMNSMSTKNELLRPRKAVDFVVSSFGDSVSFSTTPEKQAVIIRNN